MIKTHLHQCVEVVYDKTDKCPFRDRPNIYFQIVYIISGSGFMDMNGNRTAYQAGDLFLITPNDSYYFDIRGVSEFVLVKFSHEYVKQYKWKSVDHVEFLLHYAPQISGALEQTDSDRFVVKRIMELLLHDLDLNDLYNQDLRRSFSNALIVIAARNIANSGPASIRSNADKRMQEIISYIQTNISMPDKLRASVISKEFGISETYLGSYFKNQSGETIQNFISKHRVKQIEFRLRFSDMRINEIASEFGFTDESHLNKFFKKQRQLSLSAFRKQNRHELPEPDVMAFPV